MKEYQKYTCLFGGGAIRGVSYIGAIKALEELEIFSETLGGSSVGSIFAALYAVGYKAEELKDIFSKVNFNLFKDISFGIGPIFAFSKGEVFLEWIRDLIESKFYGKKYKKGMMQTVCFKDLDKNLVIITTDLANFECKEFSKNETPDYEIASAIRISCCMPGLMKPIEYNNSLLVDGDLQKSKPMWKLAKSLLNNESRILEFRLEGYYSGNEITGIDYANAVYSCMTAVSTAFVTEIYANNDKYDYVVLNTGEIVIVDFNLPEDKRNELIESGYKQTMFYFKNNLRQKKEILKPIYESIYKHLKRVNKLIGLNHVVPAKMQFGELFMDISNSYSYIDSKIIEKINNLKDLFLQNMQYPKIIGPIKLNNSKLVKAEIASLLHDVQFKLDEINDFLKLFDNLT